MKRAVIVSVLLLLSGTLSTGGTRTFLAQPVMPAEPVTPVISVAPVLPSQPIATAAPVVLPASTPVPTLASTPQPTSLSTPPPKKTPEPALTSAVTAPASPPPPPGAASSQTAVLSVIELTGTNLATFTNDLGSKFTAAMSNILGVPASSILIRNWQPASRRRALLQSSDSIVVGSLVPFGNGVAAANGLATLKSADSSGGLQAAFAKQDANFQQTHLQSAETVVPSNFQPLGNSQGTSGGLKVWAWVLIAVAGVIFILSVLFCCCRSCLCCCCPDRNEEERLPNMIKYGQKDVALPYFYNEQTFTKTANLVSKQDLQPASST